MELQPKKPSVKGPAEWFTGDVWIDGIAQGEEPSRVRVNAVRFTPGARTAWHSHAVGQTLYVTDGAGLVQSRGTDIVNIDFSIANVLVLPIVAILWGRRQGINRPVLYFVVTLFASFTFGWAFFAATRSGAPIV